MLALAEQVQSCLTDLCRSDWRSQGAAGEERRAKLPMRLSRLAIQWVHTHDSLSPKHYGQYYLHDIISHMGYLWASMLARGFSGLGEIDNSVLEHHHQEIGERTRPVNMLHVWPADCQHVVVKWHHVVHRHSSLIHVM